MPKAKKVQDDAYAGIKQLVDNIGLYYDGIMKGELDWVQLLEEAMTPEAINTAIHHTEAQNDKL